MNLITPVQTMSADSYLNTFCVLLTYKKKITKSGELLTRFTVNPMVLGSNPNRVLDLAETLFSVSENTACICALQRVC